MERSNHQQDVARLFRCRSRPLTGHKYADIMPQIRQIFRALQRQTKRRTYVRSAFFKKDKIFFDYFWIHINQKLKHDRTRRLRFFACALELLRVSKNPPRTFIKKELPNVIYHEFLGQARDGSRFAVIIKQHRDSGKKYLLSLFPLAE